MVSFLSFVGNFVLPCHDCFLSFLDVISSFMINNLKSFWINNYKSWKIMNTESTFKSLYDLLTSVWNGVPWHLFEVSFEMVFGSVIRHEDDFGNFSIFIDWFIEWIIKSRGEQSTWWCPMSSKVKTNVFSLSLKFTVELIECYFFNIFSVDFHQISSNKSFQILCSFHFNFIFLN